MLIQLFSEIEVNSGFSNILLLFTSISENNCQIFKTVKVTFDFMVTMVTASTGEL